MASYSTLTVVLLFACILLVTPPAALANSCKKRARKLCGPSSFKFYLQNDIYNIAVNNSYFNSVYSAKPNISMNNPFSFGVTSTFEDPITIGVSNTSEQIGIARGFWQVNSFTEYVLFYVFTANITKGDYTGTIDIFGLIREVDTVRILSVIGGTGDFLGAKGVAYNRLEKLIYQPFAIFTISFDLDLYY